MLTLLTKVESYDDALPTHAGNTASISLFAPHDDKLPAPVANLPPPCDLPTPPHARCAARGFVGARERGAQPSWPTDPDNISATFRLPIHKARRMLTKV